MTKNERILNSPLRDVVRAVLFAKGGEAELSDIRSCIRSRLAEGYLPRNWSVLVRDVLKHDPDIEKTDDGSWVLRTSGFDLA